jgi:hypothetical protein
MLSHELISVFEADEDSTPTMLAQLNVLRVLNPFFFSLSRYIGFVLGCGMNKNALKRVTLVGPSFKSSEKGLSPQQH